MEGENLSPDSSWRELTWSLLKIPFYWSLATIYLALSIGTGKLGKDVIYLYAPSHIVNRPIWLIKVAFKLTYGIWNIKNRDEFKRKKKKLWFKIIIRCLKWEIFKVISSSYKTIHHLIVGNKITILNREVVLNPPRLKQYLSEIDIRKVDLKFWKTGIVVFNKQSHVIIMSENEEYGFIMTSSRGFKSEDGLEVLSNSVSLENIDQRFIFSKINKSELRIEEGALFKHFANNKWHNYENFAGLILRLNLTYKYGITDTICDQGKKSMYIKLNEENENTYEKIYSWYRNTEEKNIEENLAWKLQHERDENELEKNREIEAKLYEMSNKELYIKLKENGELLEPIKGLSRSMRGEDFNWKDIK